MGLHSSHAHKSHAAGACSHHSHSAANGDWLARNQGRSRLILLATLAMMLSELVFGYWTGSMALLADGWHMAAHAGAFLVTYLTYLLSSSQSLAGKLTFGAGKLIPLGGYTNAVLLAVVALMMAGESVGRIFAPQEIAYREALLIAVLGLCVNVICALLLRSDSSGANKNDANDRKESLSAGGSHLVHDSNLRVAYYHILADALTSVLAILALFLGHRFETRWLDSVVGVLGSLIVLRWSYALVKQTAWDLLDGHSNAISREEIIAKIEALPAKVRELHLWSIGPKSYACQLVVHSAEQRGPAVYRGIIESSGITRTIVEEHSGPASAI